MPTPQTSPRTTSRTALRILTILFLLAGILLLRKPILGDSAITPAHVSPVTSTTPTSGF